MKIAICYYGLAKASMHTNAANLPVNYLNTYETHRNNLIIPNNADVFVHTWSHQYETDINEKYQPKKSIFEPQINFKEEADKICKDGYRNDQNHHILSRWYSNKKVLELMKNYEEEHSFKYDLVMITRFDCFYKGEWNMKELNPNNFYIIGGWEADYSHSLPDLCFICNSDNANKLSKMYDNIKNVYFNHNFDNQPDLWGGHLLVRRYLGYVGLIPHLRHYKRHHIDGDIVRG